MGRWLAGWLALVPCWLALALACDEAKAPEPLITARYEPARAEQPGPFAGNAALAYRGDVEALGRAGGDLLGTLRVKGLHGATDEAVNAEARKAGAARGGTHVLVAALDEYDRTEVDDEANERAAAGRAIADAGASMGCGMGNRQACLQQALAPLRPPPPAAYKTETVRFGSYLVVRVPPERWAELSPALRPEPTPEPTRPPAAKRGHWVDRIRVGAQPERVFVPDDE